MKETKQKPAYSVWQNVRFMVGRAWQSRKSVLWLCLVTAGLALALNLAQLLIAPVVLARVEQHAPLAQLLGTIGGFALALILLNGLHGYVKQNTLFSRVDVRMSIISALNTKACTTSYPNTRDPAVLRLLEKPAILAAPTPALPSTSGRP